MILLYFFTVYIYLTICTYVCTYISIESTFFHEIIFSFRLFLKMLRIEQQQQEEPIEFLLHKQFLFLFFGFVLNNFRFFRCVFSVVFPLFTFIYLIYLILQFF